MTDNVNADGVPKERDLLNPTLAALHALGGSASISEIANQVIEDMGLSATVAQVPHGHGRNQTSLKDRLAWALIDGELLIDKMKELKLGVSAKMVEVVEVDKDWFASI